jgi:dolichol-phosphate mannosyltransferase
MTMIFLILPSFNEEKNLVKIFKKINNLSIIKNITVILIDDCSTDKTKDIKFKKNKFKIIYKKHAKNMGLSIAMETGFNIVRKKAKRNDLIITMDSDNTHPIKIIPGMINVLKKNNSDIIIASRFLPNSKVKGINFFRKCLSVVGKYAFSYLYPHKNLKEYNCNFRIYRSYLIKKLMKDKKFFKNEDFNITVKILLSLIGNDKNLKISEYPLILNYHYKIGSSKMNILKNILLTLRLIILKKF